MEKKYQTASYMMVCFDDFASKCLIPPKFVSKYGEIAGQVSVALETGSGKTWDVKIKEVDGDLYMKDGWSDFAIDNGLTERDVLIFRWLHQSSTFKVSIYGDNCSLKHLTPPTCVVARHTNMSNNVVGRREKGIKRGRGRPRKSDIAHDDDEDVDLRWRFVKELKEHHFKVRRMEIPVHFVLGTGIARRTNGRRKIHQKIQVEDEEGWNKGVFSMTGGWVEYMNWSGVRVGDVLLFEFDPNYGNVVRVKVMEEEAGHNMLARARKGGMIYS